MRPLTSSSFAGMGRRLPARRQPGSAFPSDSRNGQASRTRWRSGRGSRRQSRCRRRRRSGTRATTGSARARPWTKPIGRSSSWRVTSLGDSGTVIDLGCGNGALLKKICEARAGAHSLRRGCRRIETRARAPASAGVRRQFRRRQHVRAHSARRRHCLQPGHPDARPAARGRRGLGAAAQGVAARTLRASAGLRLRRMADTLRGLAGLAERPAGLVSQSHESARQDSHASRTEDRRGGK